MVVIDASAVINALKFEALFPYYYYYYLEKKKEKKEKMYGGEVSYNFIWLCLK
jgi:hypothetical protein